MILGIDIGTSSISFVLCHGDGRQERAWTFKNDSAIVGERHNRMQDAERIVSVVMNHCASVIRDCPVERIGVTCQMHGILYVNARGRAVSPLYTWEDESGLLTAPSGKTYLEEMNAAAGVQLPRGIAFGSLTHFFLTRTGGIPAEAVRFCSIGDYVVMRLTGAKEPAVHVSNAASFGLYSLEERCFDAAAIARAGMDIAYYPRIRPGEVPAGKTEGGAWVSVAIGDNQASYLGSVQDIHGEILLNLGTGGQISCITEELVDAPGVEMRPLTESSFLAVYTTHCGGRAYAALERFFRGVAEMAGVECDHLYAEMDALAACTDVEPVEVSPAFCGTRLSPESRCEIRNLTLENFTPGGLIRGFMVGICMELHYFYAIMRRSRSFVRVVGSGNTIRKNPTMQKVVEEVFGLPLRLTAGSEEAAAGAVRFAEGMKE